MSSNSNIEWTDATWNPVVGCTAVSPGCAHCYAAGMTRRLEAMGKADYAGLTDDRHFNGTVRCLPHKLEVPLNWKKPKRIFVNSMSDLFHPEVPFEFIRRVWDEMFGCAWHTFQVLTKRPERAAEFLAWHYPKSLRTPSNIWLGTSVENQAAADARIPHLLKCPAAVRFLSCEPLLGPLDLHWGLGLAPNGKTPALSWPYSMRTAATVENHLGRQSGCIHWVIAGGESGPHARPTHPDWARSLRDQCVSAGVPFFWKQWGEWMPIFHGIDPNEGDPNCRVRESINFGGSQTMWKVGKKAAGRLLDGREWNEFPEAAHV